MFIAPSMKGHSPNFKCRTTQYSSVVAEVNHHWSRTEPVRLVPHVEQTDCEPNATHGLREIIQVPPDQTAEGESDQRHHRITQQVLLVLRLRQNRELPEAREVHA